MATVTNPSQDRLEVYLYGLIFEPGETQDVDDEIARTLGAPLQVTGLPVEQPTSQSAPIGDTPAAPVIPSETVEQPAEIAAAEEELAKAQADLAAAEAAAHEDTPAGPAAPVGGNAQ